MKKTNFIINRIENFPLKAIILDPESPYFRSKGKVPIPINGSINEYFGNLNYKTKLTGGSLYFKENAEFLLKPKNWAVVRLDYSLAPETVMYECNGNLFVGRQYFRIKQRREKETGESILNLNSHLKKLCELHETEFQNCKFEEVIGFFLDDHRSESMLFHTCSKGVTLDNLYSETSVSRDKIEKILGESFRELHKQKVAYADPLPTNLKYDLDEKIIFCPHNCIEFNNRNWLDRDIAVLLYTNDWITDKKNFLKRYLGKEISDKEFGKRIENVEFFMELMGKNQIEEIPSFWQARGKIKIN
jgi:hypothetical protein